MSTERAGSAPRRSLAPLVGPAGGPLRVLVAEDVPTNRLIAQTMLRGFGCLVELAVNGVEAVAAASRGDCDLVLMDVAMPELDGIEATRRIRGLAGPAARVPIVGLTAFALPEELQRCHDAGMEHVLTKPLRRETLHETLHAVLAARRAPVAVAQTDPAALDTRVLAELTEGLSATQVAEVLARVTADIGTHAEAALACVEAGDPGGLARACHVLKGLAGSFGIGELARLAREIEQHCRNGDAEAAMAATLSDLGRVVGAALAALADYRPGAGR